MTSARAFITNHAVLTYYLLTFAISWGGVLILGSPYGMPAPSDLAAKIWPIVFLPYFFGPSVSGLLLTGILYGRAGFREIRARLLKRQVSLRWYAAALLGAPILIALILSALSLSSAEYLPGIITAEDKVGLVLAGLVVGLIFGGLLEELGWTGFATPELRRHRSVLNTGLIVGFLWGIWHLLPTYWTCGDPSGKFDPLLFLPPFIFYLGVLPAYRVLMVWVYERCESLLVVMLMHMSLTGSTLFILAPAAQGVPLAVYYLILSAAMWTVVAVIGLADRQHFLKAARV